MSGSMEIEMFGPHDVEAGHEHALDVTEAALKAVVAMGSGETPVYYAVMGLLRASVRLGVIGLGPMVGGMEPMIRLMIEQEVKNAFANPETVQ